MKVTRGAGYTPRHRHHIMPAAPIHPQALSGYAWVRAPWRRVVAWMRTCQADDLAGVATLLGLLFACLCVGGW